MSEDTPLEPLKDDDVYHHTVVDLAQVRIQAGKSPYKSKPCEHKKLIYNQSERRIWCEDCSRTIDNFDAVMTLVRKFEKMVNDLRNKTIIVNEAVKHSARLRATKSLDRVWSGNVMAVACPHCKGGLLPEDFANGATSAWSRELEIAHRHRPSPSSEE